MGRRDHALTHTASGAEKKLWKIAAYIRLSKEDGQDVSCSVVNQKEIIKNHVDRLPQDDEHVITDYYIDDGLTGTDDSRENFQRLLQDIEAKRVNCVIVKDLSRAFRNYADQGYYLDYYFQLHQVRFISVHVPYLDSHLHPETLQSISVPIQGVVNDNHCRETSMKVRYVFDMKRSKGQFIGAFPPYGYRKDQSDKGRFIIDGEAASVVQDIFNMFVHQGMTKMGIAKKLSEHGVPNPSAYKRLKGMNYQNPHDRFDNTRWCGTTIANILKNPTYLGHMVQGRQKVISYKVHNRMALPETDWYIVRDTHEPIVDEDTFEKAGRLQQRDTRRSPGQKELYLFSGFLRCADCKKAMCRKKDGNYVYFICSSYKNHAKLSCTRHAIREDVLVQAVLETIQTQIRLVISMDGMAAAVSAAPVGQTQSQRSEALLKQRAKELGRVERLKDSLYESWQSGDLSHEDYQRLRLRYEQQQVQLRQAVGHLTREQEAARAGAGIRNPYLREFIRHKGITELNRGILTSLVENILIHEDHGITICFRYGDPFQHILGRMGDHNGTEEIEDDPSSASSL